MGVDRPTFHEAWRRVEGSVPRLRAGVQTRRRRFRGRDWWIVEDPATNQYFRMNRPAYRFVGLLDGRRRVGEAWELCLRTMGDDAPTQGEAIALLGRLYAANLLATDGGEAGDAEALFRRYQRRRTLETQGRLGSFLSLRVPLVDPDQILGVLAGGLGWVFSVWGLALWLILVASGVAALAGRWDELARESAGALSGGNLLWLYGAFVFAKVVHELAHGVACKVFGRREGAGGEVRVMGVMLLVLLPAPFVDATSAWGLRSKWRRIAVGGAGMMAELALASVAAMVWSRATEGSLLASLAANVIFIAGVSTLIFNANPLLRYDGYYMLSDWLETPNLRRRSVEFLKSLVKGRVWGVRKSASSEEWSGGSDGGGVERWLLGVYGIASSVYLLMVTAAVTLFVADQWFFIGTLMALIAGGMWFVAPVVRLARYLLSDPELDGVRGRALGITAGCGVAVVLIVGLAPVPRGARVEAVVEALRWEEVRIGTDGFVLEAAEEGRRIEAGEAALRAENQESWSAAVILRARLSGLESRYARALAEQPAEAAIEGERRSVVRGQLERARELLGLLSARASVSGIWAPDEDRAVVGAFVRRGERVGRIIAPGGLLVRGRVDQNQAASILEAMARGPLDAEVRVAAHPGVSMGCTVERLVEAGRSDGVGGGSVGGSARDERWFEVVLRPNGEAPHDGFLPGQVVVARVALDPEPIGAQAARWVRQALSRRFGV